MLSGRNSTSAEGAAPEAARHGPRTVADLAELAVLAIDRSPIAQFVADLDGRVVHANDAYCHLVGVDPDQVVGSTAADVLLASDVDQVVERVQAALDAQADPEADVDVSLELRLRRADGTVRTCDATICTGRDSAGTRWLTVHLVDVTALRQAHETTTRLARIAETTSDLVALLDGTGEVVYLNRAARRTHGLGQVTPGNLNILDFFTSDAARRVTEEVLPQLRQGRPWEGELDMRRGDGSAIHVWQTMTPEMDPAGDLQLVSVVGRDITEQKRVEAELAHQATHDSLTQLPNRAKILDHLDVELTQSRRTGRSIAVLFIDLDRFKSVNDRFGHEAGDELLRATAQRIGQVLRPTDVVGRLGGDEFVVLCAEVSDDAQARTIAERILHRLEAEPVSIAGGSVSISASIGIATSSGCREAHPEAMLREADAAMYLAKQRGRGRVELFDDSMRTRESHRRALAEELRGALSGTGLLIVHQPIVDLGTGRVTASEALVRWLHPERGLLGPHEFVGIADETGLAVELGTVVLQLACEQLATWKNGLGGESPHLHVNLSPRQLNSPALVATVQAALDRAGADPRQLCLEVSEQDLLADLEPAVAALRNLRSLGVQIAVDDFGTGHSSLAEIRRFPVDILKLDGRLVLGLGPNRGDLAIASAAVRLAHSLDLAVVAEGVETPEQLSILEELGCDRAQGFLFARPGSAAQVDELVRTGPLVPR